MRGRGREGRGKGEDEREEGGMGSREGITVLSQVICKH